MDDNLIVILLTVILMVAGSLGQLKKKKQPVVQPEPQKPQPDIWETLFGELEKPEVKPPLSPEIIPENEGKVNPDVQVAEYRPENEEGLVYIFKKEADQKESELHPEEMDVMETFSLKKAVVYSEILNPKYF